MKSIKQYLIIGAAALMGASCSDFLNTVPYDALSPTTTWKTEDDAQKFAIGCYDGWEDGGTMLYLDCMSDFGYNNFPWEGYKQHANGTMSASDWSASFYDYTIVRRCNTFLENVKDIAFADEAVKKDLIAQVRTIRAYRYFVMNWQYGGVPIIENYETAQEAQVPRKTEAEVRQFIAEELDMAIPDLNKAPAERGRIAQGAAMAIRMREALYYEDWEKAKEMAEKIISLGIYSLESNYSKLFQVAGQDSPEIILAVQYIPQTKPLAYVGTMYNNGDGGWSSMVPTHNLVDTYEMANGLTIDDPASGYDPQHPYYGRDPRMAMTIIYPGANYIKKDGSKAIFNTLDKQIEGKDKDGNSVKVDNANYMTMANNSSKTGLTWNKYTSPITQYANMWGTEACPIVFRFAEVYLTYAEAVNELEGPNDAVYNYLDEVRSRAGMPNVDRTKYATKEDVRELIRRERAVEFAGEGLRRPDILRWKTADGKMLANKVLNQMLIRRVGTVAMDANVEEGLRATIDLNPKDSEIKLEDRVFEDYMRYLPIKQENYDKNPNLIQNPGYIQF